jgi:hypothetical protein
LRRPGGKGGQDLWVAARVDASALISTPLAVEPLNSANDDLGPWLSKDGRRLYFNHDAVATGSTTIKAHIWIATRSCVP